jgi:hypothetical protein
MGLYLLEGMMRLVYRDKEAKRQWLGHVKSSPAGMIPVLINGNVFAWGFPANTGDMLAQFSLYPKVHWPKWALREARDSA